jgi:hypothetical protein
MEYRDTRSSSRAQLKSKGRKRSNYSSKFKGYRHSSGKGVKAGRDTSEDSLRLEFDVDRGLEHDAVFDEQKVKDSGSAAAKQRFVEEYERETERYLSGGSFWGVNAEVLEKLDRAETAEGSSVCDSVEECLGGMEDQFEMLDLFPSSSSAGPISDDGWAVVPEAGECRTRG